jgi:chromosome partitioning protein
MIVIAIANQKGGVGKTTTSVNLAHSLAKYHSKRVLLVDLDAQANATQWLLGRYGEKGRVVYDLMMEKVSLHDTITQSPYGVDIVPSNLNLAALDIDLIGEYYREQRLEGALKQLDDGSYHYVIVDCPPNLGVTTVNAFAACHVVIITIECKFEALEAVLQLMHTLKRVTKGRPSIIPYALPTFLDRTNVSKDVLEQIQAQFQNLCLPAIHKNTRIPEAFKARQPIGLYDETSSGAVDYMRIAKELIGDLEGAQARRRHITAAN